MAITDRLVACTAATWGGVAVDGVLDFEYSAVLSRKRGMSGGELGFTTIDRAIYDVTGFITVDDQQAPLTLCDGLVKILVITGRRPGTGIITITLGRTAASITSGALFVGTGRYSIGIGSGRTTRMRLPFIGVFHPADTQLLNAASNGLITEATS